MGGTAMGRVKSKAPLSPRRGWRRLWQAIIYTPHWGAGGLFLLLLLLTSCKTHERIVETTSHDTLYIYRHLHDSIREKDSVTVFINGDTVYRDRLRTKYVYLTATDTVEKRVYIKEPVPYEVEVPAKLPRWQRALVWFGLLCALWLAISSYKKYRRKRHAYPTIPTIPAIPDPPPPTPYD